MKRIAKRTSTRKKPVQRAHEISNSDDDPDDPR